MQKKPKTILQLYCLKRNDPHKPSKVTGAKKHFPRVYVIDKTCFDKYSLFPLIAGNSS